MRIDIDTYAFVNAANNGLVATLDLSMAESASVGMSLTSSVGAPTQVRMFGLINDNGSAGNFFTSGDNLMSNLLTIGAFPFNFMMSRISGSGLPLGEGFLIPPPLKYLVIQIVLGGGTSPTVSGTVFVWKFVR